MAEQSEEVVEQEESEQTTDETTESPSKEVVVRDATTPVNAEQQKVQDALDKVGKPGERVNAFTAIALMMKNMRQDLEGVKRTGQLPRWMRVVRVRDFKGEGAMNAIASKGVIPITNGFIKVVGFLMELALKAQELLIQADGGKALLEVGAGMIKTVASDPFYNAITETVGVSGGPNPLKPIGPVVDTAMDIVDKIPDPEDVEIIAKELYLLMAIEQIPIPMTAQGQVNKTKLPPTETLHTDVNSTGKVRLMSWGLDTLIPFHGLKAADKVEIGRLGTRRIWQTNDELELPAKSLLDWPHGEERVRIYEFSYTGEEATQETGAGSETSGADATTPVKRLSDIEELDAVLSKLGYLSSGAGGEVAFDAAMAQRLRQFQKLNELPVNGQVDNHTLNRLMNLDFEKKSLKRAKKYDATALEGFDDTKNEDPSDAEGTGNK